ncbi:hypothetical protein OIO90_002795 [Microbotryomycetes sp. JL221]|nr:hypothetical protein OIO90_002795 [Microbotryomycetes sp. JL221]
MNKFRLPLADADVLYDPAFIDEQQADEWFKQLLDINGWYQPTLKMYGREITQSRKIAAYATDPTLVVKYSGQVVNMQYDYPPVLKQMQQEIESRLGGVKFNHCMLNLYEDGKVYIGNHRDNRENRVIASLSLGAPRTFIMRHDSRSGKMAMKGSKTDKAMSNAAATEDPPEPSTDDLGKLDEDGDGKDSLLYEKKWTLANGSLVIQQGATQEKWKHEIPKEPKIKQARISVTWRQLVF